jgi:putative flippase GtrA
VESILNKVIQLTNPEIVISVALGITLATVILFFFNISFRFMDRVVTKLFLLIFNKNHHGTKLFVTVQSAVAKKQTDKGDIQFRELN